VSTVLLFGRQYFRYDDNIGYCFTLERQTRLDDTGMERPWAHALNRLLQERGLRKGELADLCRDRKGQPMRAGNISAILNSPRPPEIPTLQRLIQGFDAWHDTHKGSELPRVKLWEFFVSDEEAHLLREKRKQHERLAAPEEPDAKRELFDQFVAFMEQQRPPEKPHVVKKATK
jgi:hypothetical protein